MKVMNQKKMVTIHSFINSCLASILNQSSTKSPHKSLAIKGPSKAINEKLEIDNYQGVKVLDVNVRPLNQSVAQIRA